MLEDILDKKAPKYLGLLISSNEENLVFPTIKLALFRPWGVPDAYAG
jgi:hypothetical protein